MIAVFSGTSDGRKVVENLLEKDYSVTCFNATPYGGELYQPHKNLTVYDKKMNKVELVTKLKNVHKVVDCTHPYAQVISQNLIDICKDFEIDYMRYERPDDLESGYDSYESIVDQLLKTSGNILLTTGSNNLEYFNQETLIERVYCRVLPTVSVIKKCHDLGFSPKQIIGMQGPFDQGLNQAIFKSLDIKHLVTKSSGKAGGFKEKMDAAKALNIKTYVLSRPNIDYGLTYDNLDNLLREF
ncbi:precorrin-6A reductase [Acidaminobacter sp. JC074]|uniref:precorrin-6A reductase n=1 Tax=Acidaminobacter sp. JC074 TaxID=2530199 RepID=UPI001F0D4938|nr:precorrin-6A reductase [Acidaminobacter sp. JC074]